MKKLITLLLTALLCLLCAGALGEGYWETVEPATPGALYPYEVEGVYCLIDDQGNKYAQDGWAKIFTLIAQDGTRRYVGLRVEPIKPDPDEDGFISDLYFTEGKYFMTLLGDHGEKLTDEYDYIYEQDGAIIVEQNQRRGVLGWDGSVIVPPEYGTILVGPNNSYLLLDENSSEIMTGKGVLMMKGAKLPIKLDGVSMLDETHEGLTAAQHTSGKWGYIDITGKWVIQPIFTYTYSFDHGCAMVCTGDWTDFGIIDKSGNYLLPPEYDSVDLVAADNYSVCLTLKGDTAEMYADGDYTAPVATVKGVSWGYIVHQSVPEFELCDANNDIVTYDINGKPVEKSDSYDDYTEQISEDLRIVYTYSDSEDVGETGGARLIRADGTVVLENFDGLVPVMGEDGPVAIIAHNNRRHRLPDGTLQILWNSTKYSLFDTEGNALLPMDYDSLWPLNQELYYARKGSVFGVINLEGEWIVKDSDFNYLDD